MGVVYEAEDFFSYGTDVRVVQGRGRMRFSTKSLHRVRLAPALLAGTSGRHGGRSVTVYWMTVPGRIKSTMFRGVPALQEWLELRLENSYTGMKMSRHFLRHTHTQLQL